MPTNGKSAIDIEQPPSASADTSSAPKTSALFLRSADMPEEVPFRWYEPCSDKRSSSSISLHRSNHCRPKRLEPEEQIAPLGLQYVGTKMLCRSAARHTAEIGCEPAVADQRGDELQMTL